MKKIIISSLIILLMIFTGYSAYVNLVGLGKNSDAGLLDNDNWSFSGNYIYTDPVGVGGIYAKIVGEINSDLYGKFQFGTGASNVPIEFISYTNTTLCGVGKTVYKIVGDIESLTGVWPTMSFTGSSYYCPGTNSWSGTVYSDLLGYKQMGNINTLTSSGAGIGAIFNNDSLLIQGIIGKGKNNINIINAINTANNNSQQSIFVDIQVSKSTLNLLVNKNIAILTKTLTPITNTTPIDDLSVSTKKIYYYNYEGSGALSFSNEKNKGKILKIGNNIYSDPGTNYQVGVSGKKTIIVKGGNIYINADIYNTNDSTSLLVLVAKRDSTNNKNGGNIYINPNVTNIDAVLIADGSIINYDGTSVVTDSGKLMKQLLIYGSLYTKNIIGQSASTYNPYGSDGYIEYGKTSKIGIVKYDLMKLRYFSLITSPATGVCNSIQNYLVPKSDMTSISSMQYAWVGKRKCFNQPLKSKQDGVLSKLRGTNRFNPVIIKYNTSINTISPRILLK